MKLDKVTFSLYSVVKFPLKILPVIIFASKLWNFGLLMSTPEKCPATKTDNSSVM